MPKSNLRIILSQIEKELLNGCLLGDGYLYLNNRHRVKSLSSFFGYTSSQKQHTDLIANLLKKFGSGKYKNGSIKHQKFLKKTQKFYINYTFHTQSNITFFNLYEKWYPQRKKIVPRDLELTSLTCLLWYIGDGCLCKTNQKIILNTHGFCEDDIDFLIDKLNNLGFESYKNHWRQQYIILIPRKNVKKFLDYIGPCPVECYNYKWEYREYKGTSGVPKKVNQFDLDGNFIRQWVSGYNIRKELGYCPNNISACCLNKQKTAYGFKWRFAL